MKRYDSYKDSGVQWLGIIPNHWKTQKVKFTFNERSEKNHPDEPILCATQSQGVIPQSMYENRVVVVNKGFENLKLVKVGDFVISLRSFQGGIEYAYYQGIISAAYTVLTPNDTIFPGFARHLMKSYNFVQLLQTCVTGIREGQNINYDLLKNKFIPIPPISEQKTIVSYLDNKTSEIDELVVKVEHEIELLKEYKQAEIARVVTHGLNPNAPTKPSGISWIGDIPAHWSTRKIKFTFEERSEKNHPDEPVLCATQSQGVIPQSMYDNRVVVVNKGFENLKFVEVGDFVISLRSFQGGIEYAYYQGIISAAYTILRPNDFIDSGYARALLKSHNFIQLLKTCVTGIREGQNINYDLLKNKYIPIPPKEEQKEIVKYIEYKTTEIDRLVVELTYQVEYLKEYKQKLIADVVTGKINVQNN